MKLEVDLSETIEKQLEAVAIRVWQNTMLREAEKRFYPEWMDLETTAKYLNVSRSNLTKFIKELDFPVTIISGTKRVSKRKADEWMQDHEY